jgi:hypothetical protein
MNTLDLVRTIIMVGVLAIITLFLLGWWLTR